MPCSDHCTSTKPLQVALSSDLVINVGPGAGEECTRVVAAGPPAVLVHAPESRTAPYLARVLG